MSLIKIPQSSLDFLKKNQDEIFESVTLLRAHGTRNSQKKIKEISGFKKMLYA